MTDANETHKGTNESSQTSSEEERGQILQPLFRDLTAVLKKYGITDFEVASFTLRPSWEMSSAGSVPFPEETLGAMRLMGDVDGLDVSDFSSISEALILKKNAEECSNQGKCTRYFQGGGYECVDCHDQ